METLCGVGVLGRQEKLKKTKGVSMGTPVKRGTLSKITQQKVIFQTSRQEVDAVSYPLIQKQALILRENIRSEHHLNLILGAPILKVFKILL